MRVISRLAGGVGGPEVDGVGALDMAIVSRVGMVNGPTGRTGRLPGSSSSRFRSLRQSAAKARRATPRRQARVGRVERFGGRLCRSFLVERVDAGGDAGRLVAAVAGVGHRGQRTPRLRVVLRGGVAGEAGRRLPKL